MEWWAVWTGAAAGALFILVLYSRSRRRLTGRLVVLTGGDSADGMQMARELAKKGARVIITSHDHTLGSNAADSLSRETGTTVEFRHLDLSSFKSVKEFGKNFQLNERHIDVLINGASVSQLDNSLTEDGISVEMQINHFGPYLLTNLLVPLLKRAPQGRIVTVSSVMHYLGNINIDTIADKARDKHAHKRMFANSKLCNILFTRELSRRLNDTRVTANCFHPGLVNNGVEETAHSKIPFFNTIMSYWNGSPGQHGTTTGVYLAASPKLDKVSGKYFVDCKETKPSKAALDDALAEKLWDVSENLVRMQKCFFCEL